MGKGEANYHQEKEFQEMQRLRNEISYRLVFVEMYPEHSQKILNDNNMRGHLNYIHGQLTSLDTGGYVMRNVLIYSSETTSLADSIVLKQDEVRTICSSRKDLPCIINAEKYDKNRGKVRKAEERRQISSLSIEERAKRIKENF